MRGRQPALVPGCAGIAEELAALIGHGEVCEGGGLAICRQASSTRNQQLMLQKKRFGNDCAGTAGSHGSDRRDDQMSHQDEPIPHTANDGRAGRKLQDYEPVANCVRISIRHGQAIAGVLPEHGSALATVGQ
jgi:hypothetical protein